MSGLCAGLHDSPMASSPPSASASLTLFAPGSLGQRLTICVMLFSDVPTVRVRKSQAFLVRDLFYDSKVDHGFVQRPSVEDGA